MTDCSQYGVCTPEINTEYLTYEYQPLRKSLEVSGWKTPQTYCNRFEEEGDFPAVYLFMLVERLDYTKARPAYVGMSTRLAQRWSGHTVLRELEQTDFWVQRWFLRTPKPELRSVETNFIQKFDPPWNIVGRRRGLAAL